MVFPAARQHGASVCARTRAGAATALHRAAAAGHTAVAELLLRAGADPLAADADGLTPKDKAGGWTVCQCRDHACRDYCCVGTSGQVLLRLQLAAEEVAMAFDQPQQGYCFRGMFTAIDASCCTSSA